jgi:hydrogenase maturation protease
MNSSILVLGLGNILLSDEGIGVHAASALKKRYSFAPEVVEVIDGGTMGLDLLPLFEGKDKIIIIDAVDFGKEPGYISIISNDAIPSALKTKLSVHHIGLSDVLYAAKFMGVMPSDVCLIGVQPGSLDVSLDMTDEIQGKLDELVNIILVKLKQWDIEYCLKDSDAFV